MSRATSPALVGEMLIPALVERVAKTVEEFCGWLERYGDDAFFAED